MVETTNQMIAYIIINMAMNQNLYNFQGVNIHLQPEFFWVDYAIVMPWICFKDFRIIIGLWLEITVSIMDWHEIYVSITVPWKMIPLHLVTFRMWLILLVMDD